MMEIILVFLNHVLKGILCSILVLLFLPWKLVVLTYAKVFRQEVIGTLVNCIGTMTTLLDSSSDPDQNKLSMCCYLRLSGELSLQDLRILFEKNVLRLRLPCGRKLRYPELSQYPVSLGGYLFWRHDASFRIENHVRERVYYSGEEIIPSQQELFEEVLNLPFPQGRSPWECLLLKSGGGGGGDGSASCCYCVLLLRMHHVMADARSMVKLVVEGLGGTELKTARSQESSSSSPPRQFMQFLSLLPYHAINLSVRVALLKLRSQNHPWKISDIDKDKSPFVVASSSSNQKLALQELKRVGRRAGIHTSAVIMAIISGAIRRFDKRAADIEGHGIPCGWPFPKPAHPPTLTNHVYAGLILSLPTDVEERAERLRRCGQLYRQARVSKNGAVMDLGAVLLSSTVVTPLLAQFSQEGNDLLSMGVTNVAGHSEGLWIGGKECVDFNFCVNIPRNSIGVIFVVFSYKECVQISVVAKSSILSPSKIGRLVKFVEMEAADLLCQ